MHDPWTILGVDRSASADEIKAAYRRLAKDHHPDKGGDPNRFIEIQNAYKQLTEPQKQSQTHNHSRHPFEDIFGAQFEEVFSRFGFGPNPNNPHWGRRNPNIEAHITISVVEHIEGCTKTVEIRDQSGSRMLEINVPKGAQTGDVLKYTGQGSKQNSAAPAGDLFVRLTVQPYDDFEFHHGDLATERTISVWQALLGCNLTVKDPYGKTIQYTVPAGIQPGTVMRIVGNGGLRRNSQQRGDILIKTNVQMVKLTPEQQQIIEQWT